jgi:hypothetical protein
MQTNTNKKKGQRERTNKKNTKDKNGKKKKKNETQWCHPSNEQFLPYNKDTV